MYQIIVERKVEKFIKKLPPKHQVQVKKYILNLQENPIPHDSKLLKNYELIRRGDSGEYRIIYTVDEKIKTVYVILVGKRNGEEVYRILKNLLCLL